MEHSGQRSCNGLDSLAHEVGRVPALSVLIPLALGIYLERYSISHTLGLALLVCGLLFISGLLVAKDAFRSARLRTAVFALAIGATLLALGSLRMAYDASKRHRATDETPDYRRELSLSLQQSGIDTASTQLITALSLGYLPQGEEVQALREQFALSGAAHLLVVSGYHLALVVYLLSLLLRPIKWRHIRLYYLLLMLSAWGFALLVGLGASTTRAALVLTLFLSARFLGREVYPPNVLASAAVMQLAYNPHSLYSWGMWLSYIAVISIYLYYDAIRASIGQLVQPILARLWDALCLSLSAQILTLPLVLYLFGQMSFAFVLTTLPLALLSSLLIPLALVAELCLYWGIGIGLMVPPLRWLSQLMLDLTAWASQLEMLTLRGTLPLWGLIGLWLVACTLRLIRWRR